MKQRWLHGALWLISLSFLGSSDESCSKYKWNPADQHPCTITRMSLKEFSRTIGLLPPMYPEPLVIVDDQRTRNLKLQHLSAQSNILANFPENFNVTLSSSNSFSEHRRTIPFRMYIEEMLTEGELTPDKLSNETWYLFGETYSEQWKDFLDVYEVPPCEACNMPDLVALSFGVGNRGSGVQWHVHGPGFSEAVVGRKHWILQQDRPVFHKDQTSRNWMEYSYSAMEESERPLECTLEPGDLIYFPDMYWHATINLDRTYLGKDYEIGTAVSETRPKHRCPHSCLPFYLSETKTRTYDSLHGLHLGVCARTSLSRHHMNGGQSFWERLNKEITYVLV